MSCTIRNGPFRFLIKENKILEAQDKKKAREIFSFNREMIFLCFFFAEILIHVTDARFSKPQASDESGGKQANFDNQANQMKYIRFGKVSGH